MKRKNLFFDNFVDFDTMSDGKSTVELFDQLAGSTLSSLNDIDLAEIAKYEKSSNVVGDRRAETALAAFRALGLMDPVGYGSGQISVGDVREFVDRFDNAQSAKAAAYTSGSGSMDKAAMGIGGFTSYIYSKLFLSRFQVADNTLRMGSDKVLAVDGGDCAKVTGKIRDYLFIADPNDKRKGSGHLSVEMLFEVDRDEMQESLFFHWDISVRNYTVHVRDDSRFPDFPFPELQGKPNEANELTESAKVVFPKSSTDPGNPISVWARGLNHKLFAEGGKDDEGKDNFTIDNIYRSRNGGPLERLDDRHEWYQTPEGSCVDLMFKGYPPAAGLPPQTNYCLGRCAHPRIVNTCGG